MGDRGISRRALLGGTVGVAATAAVGSRVAGAAGDGVTRAASARSLLPPERIGLQLYSVRTAVAEQGFAKVLETVAEIGFKQIEFAGYTQGTGPITLQELRALLDANGLIPAGSHVSPSDDASMETILDEAEILGLPQVGLSLLTPSGPPSVAGWKAAAEQYNRYGELAAKRGIGFYLHNHFQEWFPTADDPSRRGMDVLLEETDPRFVFFELDIFWAHVGRSQSGGGFDPLTDYAIPHRDRYKLFHVKDGLPDSAQILDVGEGEIDFQHFFTELFAQSKGEVGKHLYLWERDSADDHPRGALAAARSSFVNMRYGLVPAKGSGAATGFKATIAGTAFGTTKRGRRRLRVKLRLNRGARVTATLTRGGKTLATATRNVKKGSRAVNLRVPRSAGPGPAKLRVAVSDGTGVRLVMRDVVRVPPRP